MLDLIVGVIIILLFHLWFDFKQNKTMTGLLNTFQK